MTKQNWHGVDGAIAWHLIERQAENWNQVGEMMNEWLKVNTPTKEWVGLTDEEIYEVYEATEKLVGEHWNDGGTTLMFPLTLYKAIESKLKEKNVNE